MTTTTKPPKRWRHFILASATLALLLSASPTLAAPQAAAQTSQVVTSDPAAPDFERVGLSMDTVNECVIEDPVRDVIYACHYRGMMRSFDGGLTWERAGEFDKSPIAPEGGLERRHYISGDVDSIGRVFVGNIGARPAGWSAHLTGQVRMSVDQGSTWKTITPPSLHATNAEIDSRVRDIIVDRDNADANRKDIVYYCAGNRVYRSWDNQHEVDPQWGPLDAGNNPVGIQEEIKWDAITPNIGAHGAGPNGGLGPAKNECRQMLIHNDALYVATRDGVWRSDNYDLPLSPYGPPDSSPINWTLITPAALNGVGIESIAFDPGGRLFASTEWKRNFDEGLWQSSDPAAATPTFQRLHGRLGSRLAVTASGALLTGSIADIWRTPDPMVAPTTKSPIQTAEVLDFEELVDGTLLAATWGAGILRSTDDGQTWNSSNEGQHFFPAPRAVDQSGRIYAKSGTGVLYSDDDGQNFHHCGRFPTSTSFLRESRVSSMAMHSGSLFVLMHHPSGLTGLWSSTDQCQSFTQVSQSPNGQGGRLLTVTANGTMLAVFGHPGDLYRSTDLGLTWTPITNSLPAPTADSPDSEAPGVLPINDIQLAPDGTIWLLGDYNDVYRSTDDGVTWQAPMRLETGAAHIGYVPGGAFGFAANGDTFIGGIRGIYKVPAGTRAVEPLLLADTDDTYFQFHSVSIDSTGRIYAAAGGSNVNSLLGVYVSEDHGETWVHEPNSLRDRLHANVWVNPQTDTVMVSTWGDGLSRREAPAVMCNGQIATIVGTPGDDPYIRATEGDDIIHGLGGDDTIYGLGGDDIICGGDGDDSLVADAGHGPDGVDLIFGGGGNDHIFAGGGADTAHGGSGDDKLHGQDGNDRLFGDAGDDELHGNAGDDFADGGDGNDRLHGYDGNDSLIGGRGNDYAKGGPGSDSINGQAGNDELHGSEHNDRIWGSWGDDIIRGDGGTDTLNGNQGDDTLIGGHGNDRLWGGDGHDTLDGQWGNDRLGGQNGDDSLNGGPGTDTLGGGDGTDTCVNGERLWSCEDPTTTAALINWTPSGGTWQAHATGGANRVAGVQWGVNSDVALTGDIDADGSDDLIIYRPSNARWYAKDADGAVLLNHLVFGNPASISQPLVGDVDGDNDDDFVIWDETLGRFFTTDSDGTAGVGAVPLGTPGDVALLGDIDGDGSDDFIVWRPSNGRWYAMDSDGLTSQVDGLQWGRNGDVPLIGDVNGDGIDDFVVWRPANGRWYAREAGGTVLSPAVQWGVNGDVPVVGDLNEDGKDDFLIWRPGNQRWYARGADNTVLLNNIQAGTASDTPLFGVLQR